MTLTKKAQELIKRQIKLKPLVDWYGQIPTQTKYNESEFFEYISNQAKISQLKEDWIDWLQDELLEAETSSWIIGYLKGLEKKCPPMLIKQNERTIVRVSDLQNALKIIADASHPQTAGSNEPSVLEDK